MGHIVLMTIGWVFVLPLGGWLVAPGSGNASFLPFIGVMFYISRSRFCLPIQFVFLLVNAVGVLLATIYKASTPDLYPNNAHHKLGWILTWIMSAQAVMGILHAYARKDCQEFTPISTEAIAEHQRMQSLRQGETYRFSNDSGQGTEPNTESLRSNSFASADSIDNLPEGGPEQEDEEQEEKHGLMHGSAVDKYLARKIPGLLSSHALKVSRFLYNTIDRLILILGSVAVTTGIITYGGFFVSFALDLGWNSANQIRWDLECSVASHTSSKGAYFSGTVY